MPELPEVETTKRQLVPDLVGRRIERVRLAWPRTLTGDIVALEHAVLGARVQGLDRRGKYLLAEVSGPGGSQWLSFHLRMSGRLMVCVPDACSAYVRCAFDLDDGKVWAFDDVRKFGRLRVGSTPADVLPRLGPEPDAPELDGAGFHQRLQARRGRIKPLLLDQQFIAGVGNIYADESLHRAGIHPLTPALALSPRRAALLRDALRQTLAEAIAQNGSSFDTFYRTPEGRPGGFQAFFRVYGRTDAPCHHCGGRIRRIVVAQRSAHFCGRCQRLPRRR